MTGMIELVGISNESYSDAVKKALEEYMNTGKKVFWFEVVEQRGAVRDGKIEFQVVIKVGTSL
jgi:hypothetical protein